MKRILLLPDIVDPPWAWARRAMGIQKYASPGKYEVDILPETSYKNGMNKDYDVVLTMGWMSGPTGDNVWGMVSNLGILFSYKPQAEDLWQRCASPAKNRQAAEQRIPKFKGIITIDRKTTDFLKSLNSNTVYLRTGVDDEVFVPQGDRQNGRLYCGWIGKRYGTRWTPKGYSEVLWPLVERLSGSQISFCLNSRDFTNALSTDELVRWYNSFDLLLVTSTCDSTPSTLLEAMACGRPFVATNVGIVEEVLKEDRACGFMLPSYRYEKDAARIVDLFEDTLLKINGRPEALEALGSIASGTIARCFSWRHLADTWAEVLTQ